uniref:Zinc finger protein 786 n=1 Tax=Culex pipiens TaxID=7175 RepID=A0A8D8CEK3_CULPI
MLLALRNFPNVCRLCLRTEPEQVMVSILETVPEFGEQLSNLLDDFCSAAPEDIVASLPSTVCQQCLKEFIAAYKLKQRQEFLLRVQVAYARFKFDSNVDSLRQLYDNNADYMRTVFCELGIINENEMLDWDALVDQKPDFERIGKTTTASNNEISFDMVIDKEILTDEIKIEFVDMEVNDFQTVQQKESKSNNNRKLELVDKNKAQTSEQSKNVDSQTRDQNLSCGSCDYSTCSTEAFEYHLQNHPVSTRICDIDACGKQFKQRKCLVAHKKSAHSRFMCANCYVTLKDEHSLKVHAKWHEGETLISCFYCPMKFEAKDEYRLHLDTIHGANECHSCDTCGLQFKDVTALRSHLRSHADVRNFKCPDCDKTFKFRKDVVRHKKAVHANERFTCKYCSKSYVRNDKLRQHIERSHDLQTYFLCEICVKSFPTKEQLQEHKGHHAAPRTHQCATCMVTYPGQKELKAHQCITYRDDYVCCERDFKFHRHYNRHMFLAHGEKTNVRVKPDSMLKYKSRCKKCNVVFESTKLKTIHEKVCKKQEKAQKQVVTTYL